MVQTYKVGKARAPIRGLLLTIVTFGIYPIYWMFKAHSEVFEQFELRQDGRDQGWLWFVLGIIFSVFFFVYAFFFIGNVNYVTNRLGHQPRITPVAFIGWHVAPFVILIAAAVALDGIAEPTGMPSPIESILVFSILGLFLLLIVPYFKLQADINDLWKAYDRRMSEMVQPSQEPDWS